MDSTRCTLRLPQSLDKKVERAALHAGVTRSELIRRLISDSLSRGREDEISLRSTVARLHNRLTTLQNSHDMLLSMLSLFIRRWYTHQRPITDRKERAVAEALGEKAHKAFLKQLLESPDQLSELLEIAAPDDDEGDLSGQIMSAAPGGESPHLAAPSSSAPPCDTVPVGEAAGRHGAVSTDSASAARLRVPPRPNVPALTDK
jgi:hypothetical protein